MKNLSLFLEDLTNLIAFKSVEAEAKEGMPFGEENFKALEYFLSIARRFGFDALNHDGYIGEITFGEGEEVGIIGHLDVVPTGIGWNTDPFTLTIKDGVLYGRGVLDDKGAPLMCLYALKELKDSGAMPKRKFRLFVGCNEESGWRDVEYYKTIGSFPEYGFSPDGNFPLSYAEKGMCVVDFFLPKFKRFSKIKGGTAVNAVCDYACMVAQPSAVDTALLKKHGLILKEGNIIESFGKAAHGSQPALGKNAIKPLLQYALDLGEDVKEVIDCLFLDKFGLGKLNNEQGFITFSPDIICEEGDRIKISCDMRIPAPFDQKDVLPVLDKFNIAYSLELKHPPMMVEKNGWLVDCLLSAYNEQTNQKAQPFSMGGSTFARAFKKGCAFGPGIPDESGNIHDANEFVRLDDLLKCYEIYKRAIFNLALK